MRFVALVGCLLFVRVAQAQSIVDPSFEASGTTGMLVGWTTPMVPGGVGIPQVTSGGASGVGTYKAELISTLPGPPIGAIVGMTYWSDKLKSSTFFAKAGTIIAVDWYAQVVGMNVGGGAFGTLIDAGGNTVAALSLPLPYPATWQMATLTVPLDGTYNLEFQSTIFLLGIGVPMPGRTTTLFIDNIVVTPPGVTFTKSNVAVVEGGATNTYSIRLNTAPTANVTIDLFLMPR